MDLIIGMPDAGMNELQRTLDEMAKLRPESLALQTLSLT